MSLRTNLSGASPARNKKPLDEAYAKRTACRDQLKIHTGVQHGSRRWTTYTDCEYRRMYRCKFSHSIFSTDRIAKLARLSDDGLVSIHQKYGFEIYGAYEGTGWGHTLCMRVGGQEETYDGRSELTKAIAVAEHRRSTPFHPTKQQTLCPYHKEDSAEYLRAEAAQCRFDHSLIDGERIDRLVRWPANGFGDAHYFTLECRVSQGVVAWKLTLNADAFVRLSPSDALARKLPPRPIVRQGASLLEVVRSFEELLGLAGRPIL